MCWKKIGMIAVTTFMMGILLAGCGQKKTDALQSPNLIGAQITSYNEGSEKDQYVKVALEFDKPISISDEAEDSLRVSISGERIQPEEFTIEQGTEDEEAILTISVDYVTKGILEIQKSEKSDVISDILNSDGTYVVNDFEIEGLIPSGVTLSDVAADESSVTKQVDSVWNIRSIAWVCLTKDGEVIPVQEEDALEELDGRIAVHGHEFLMEDDGRIAEKIVESLERGYGSEYQFSSTANQITATATNGETGQYDIEIYQYLKINGEEVLMSAEEQQLEESTGGHEEENSEEHELGLKSKVSEIDREVTEDEQTFLDKLHIASLTGEPFTDGSELYTTLTITGDAMPEENVYSVRDLEGLIELSYQNQAMNELDLPLMESRLVGESGENEYYGIDLVKFLTLSGVDFDSDTLYLIAEQADGTMQTIDLKEKRSEEETLMLVFATQEGPLHVEDEIAGPIALAGSEIYGGVEKLIISKEENGEDPCYRFHNREPYIKDLDKTFTVEVYKKGAEYMGAIQTKTYTTEEMESLMLEYPEHVTGGYYGTIGNEEIFNYMGVGGWIDYFEGIDLYWLLAEHMGLGDLSGSAELIGRDQEVYAQIENLDYLAWNEHAQDYYTMTADGVKITGMIPMVACTKNGYPILPEHDHESEGYIAYSYMNEQLEHMGVETEIGVIKNHNGPFIACLGNLDGCYGGNQIETGGDCVAMKIYLN